MGESNDYQYHEIRGKYHSRERWHFEFISSKPRIHHFEHLEFRIFVSDGKALFFLLILMKDYC